MKPDPRTITMRSERFPIGDGFSVEFRLHHGRLDAEWSPDLPGAKPHLLPAYRRARDEFMQRVGKRIGGAVAVVEA